MANNIATPQNIEAPLKSGIRKMLLGLGAINEPNIEVFSKHTRDKNDLTVYRDKVSKVIFIDNYYVGEDEYISGKYRQGPKPLMKVVERDYEDLTDSERRFNAYRKFVVGKSIVDFGCGAGSFLRLSKATAKNVSGIELHQDFLRALNVDGISCFSDLNELKNEQDSFFMFHCLEHLPDPAIVLKNIHKKLRADGNGKIVIEVPHARDFLIDKLSLQAFIDFTLWSQHLILHTRESLTLMLADAGFKNIHIEGVQRYSLANHLHWLNNRRPGGHKESLSIFETANLVSAYSYALSKIDANDTLVAVAQS